MDRFHSFCSLRCVIFDELRLINDLAEEREILIQFDIAAEQIVRGNQNILHTGILDHLFSLFLCAGDESRLQLRSKAGTFALPVIDERCRCNDQRTTICIFGCFLHFR